jgi:hypothetical protein
VEPLLVDGLIGRVSKLEWVFAIKLVMQDDLLAKAETLELAGFQAEIIGRVSELECIFAAVKQDDVLAKAEHWISRALRLRSGPP